MVSRFESVTRSFPPNSHPASLTARGVIMQPSHLIEQIRAAMESKGITQDELARLSGVTQPRISDILAGKKDPRISTYARLIRGLGLSCEISSRQ